MKLSSSKITFIICLILVGSLSVPTFAQNKGSISLFPDQAKLKINKDIYGHFAEHLGACIYGGFWVGEKSPIPNTDGIRNDVVNALRQISIPNLRWPGGCFADTYHWKDGIGPKEKRPSIINTNWGGVTEDNSFGTHEFMRLTELLGCDAYINGNIGSGTVQEMSEWVEYLTSSNESPMTKLRKENGRDKPWKVKYWAVGNETWGCGGNMTPDYYGNLFRQYSTFMHDFAGNRLEKVASGASDTDYNWMETMMKNPKNREMMQGISLHYYTIMDNWSHKGSATQFTEKEWFTTIRKSLEMDKIVTAHSDIMDKYDPQKRVSLVVDEWGNWFDVEPGTNPGFLFQQNTMRDAMVAALNLNIFNNHCDRVRMANLAQAINVLQSLILTKNEKMVLTPTYYVFKMWKVHQDATLVSLKLKCEKYIMGNDTIPSVTASASKDAAGKMHITLANFDPNKTQEITCDFSGGTYSQVKGEILTANAMNACNTFDKPDEIKPVNFTGATLKNNILKITLPSKSVVAIEIN
jgi:alpha-N-arabinofuranosidase